MSFDYLFRRPVSGGRLPGEDIRPRHVELSTVLDDTEILMDYVHDVEELPFILVDSLYLDIVQAVGIYRYTGYPVYKLRETFLIHLLDAYEFPLKILVPGIRFERSQLVEIGYPAVADSPVYQAREAGVAVEEPPPLCNPVCFVVELLGRELIKIRDERGLYQLRMQRSHAVYGVAAYD